MPKNDLVGGIGDRLVGRGAGPADGVRVGAARQHRQQRDLPRDVRLDDRRYDGAVHDRFDELAVEVGTLHELRDGQLAELDCREILERRARFRERRPYAGHYRDATAIRSERCHAWKVRYSREWRPESSLSVVSAAHAAVIPSEHCVPFRRVPALGHPLPWKEASPSAQRGTPHRVSELVISDPSVVAMADPVVEHADVLLVLILERIGAASHRHADSAARTILRAYSVQIV